MIKPSLSPAPLRAHLRLLGTSDVHMHLTAWDARTDTDTPDRGFDRLASLIDTQRRSAPGAVLLCDNGDALQGTLLADTAAEADAPHPWADIVNAMGYDAIGLGNHDFDYGLGALRTVCRQMDAPVISASPTSPLPHVAPGVLTAHPIQCSDGQTRSLRIGVTSVLPPQTLIWNHAQLQGKLQFYDGLYAARKAVERLQNAGADLIVMLCHSGLPESEHDADENFAASIAAQVPGIDAMILGHTHAVFPAPSPGSGAEAGAGAGAGAGNPTNGCVAHVPAVMPGFAGAWLGQIDLDLCLTQDRWHVTQHSAQVLRAAPHPPDPHIQALAAPSIKATRARADRIVGHTDQPMSSYFAMLQSSPIDALVAEAMITALCPLVEGTALAALPKLAAVCPVAVGGRAGPANFVHIAPGPIRERDLAHIHPFRNTVWAHDMDGATLRRYVEQSAQYFAPQSDGQPAAALAPGAPSFNFDMLHGLTARIDPFAPVGQRVRSLQHEGAEIGATDRFAVAMTSYRGAGGGQFPGTGAHAPVQSALDCLAVTRAQCQRGPIKAQRGGSVWHFETDRRRQVVIETHPAAIDHLDHIAPFAPEVIGPNAAGFLEIKVTL